MGESVQRATRLRTSTTLLVLLSLATFLSTLLFGIREGALVVPIFYFLFGSLGYAIARRWGRVESHIFAWVYCVAVLSAIIIFNIYVQRYGTPYYVGGSDDLIYERDAEAVVSRLSVWDYGSIRGGVVKQTHNSVGYVYLISLLYRAAEPLGGFHTMLPRLLNCLVLGMLAVLTYRLAKLYSLSEITSRWCALLVGLLPIMVYNSIHTFRDVIVSLLTLWVVYIWAMESTTPAVHRRILLWAQTFLIALIVTQFRAAQAVAILAVALIGDLWSSQVKARAFSARSLYRLALVLVVLATLLFVLPDTLSSFAQRLGRGQSAYTQYRLGMSDGLAAYVFSAPVPLTYVLRVPYALITPLPILSAQLERLWLSAGTVIWYLLLPFFVLGFIRSVHSRSKSLLLGAFLLLFGGTVLISFSQRHISQYLPYGILIAEMGWERYRAHRIPVLLGATWLGCGLIIVYVVLKAGL